jgi:hypothetical protein
MIDAPSYIARSGWRIASLRSWHERSAFRNFLMSNRGITYELSSRATAALRLLVARLLNSCVGMSAAIWLAA